jgi:cytochrome c553
MLHAASPRAFELMKEAVTATPNAQHGGQLFTERCASCHGPQAWGDGSKKIPSLASQREFYLLEQLVLFSSLDRYVPAMHQALTSAGGLGPQDFRDLSAYLAGASHNPRPQHGDGRALKAGGETFARSCAMCHGKTGEGSDREPIPAIGGQHYSYVLAQMEGFASGHRSLVEPPVIDFTAGLSTEERNAVADYVSRLTARAGDH